MGFTKHFYIIFGTNLLTEGTVQIAVFSLFQCFAEKEYQTESKQNETFGRVIFGTNMIQMTWSGRQERSEEATRQGGAPAPLGAPPPLWAPRSSTDLLLPPIYIHIPRKHPGAPRNPIFTAATFCTREIPSWGLFWRSAGGGIDHGGLLHQHHSLSDDV
ncbi:hypothetical protein VPH35_037821 [Triticum aestivum]